MKNIKKHPLLGDTELDKVQTIDITYALNSIVKREAHIHANRILSTLKQAFGYTVNRGNMQQNPTANIQGRHIGGVEKPGERYLSVGEIKTIWHFIDFEKSLWPIRPEHTKGSITHKVHLSALTKSVFQKLRSISDDQFVLPGLVDNQPLNESALDPVVIEKYLGHKMPRIMATYNKNEMLSQRKKALEQWACCVENLLRSDTLSKQSLFKSSNPYQENYLKVSPLHELWYAQYGNPSGIPVIVLHGGPGAGYDEDTVKLFDPTFWRIILLDQRASQTISSVTRNERQYNSTSRRRLRNPKKRTID
ncbi:MAG: hypothetical protein NXI01_05825 [Gammaproteobacteria bacterium]|nr:hypothetical protein [Gammaproteobacteria bacterium]